MPKRTMYRIIALTGILVLAVVLFFIGKGHTLLLDNQDITINGSSYKATHAINVMINDQKTVLVKAGKRKKADDLVAGPWHRITIEILDDEKNVLNTVEKKFSVGLKDMLLLQLPALVENDPLWIQPFEPPKRR